MGGMVGDAVGHKTQHTRASALPLADANHAAAVREHSGRGMPQPARRAG